MSDAGQAPALEARGVSKAFGPVQALDAVDLRVRPGSVHGLVGENGSGKSTLTKIMAGVVRPEQGTVLVDGEPLRRFAPRESLRAGIRVIYQDLALFPSLTVAENLTFEGDAPFWRRVRWQRRRERARRALAELDLDIDPATRVGELPTAERQLVAIVRAVSADPRIILMDEPTAALTQDEIDRLLTTIRRLSERGLSFVFISHKLREVVTVADDVTVLRNGTVVETGPADTFDAQRISRLMTGGNVEDVSRGGTATTRQEPVLQVRDLLLPQADQGIDLDLHAGRVVGLAGLVGSGRTAIGLALAGLIAPRRGDIRFHGQPVTQPRALKDLQYVPEDRLSEGLFLEWAIADNIVIQDLDSALGRHRLIERDRVRELGQDWVERLAIKAPSVDDAVTTLSGGNQQRVLLARALAPRPEVVILNNPTVGVDVGSRADIHRRIREVADEGAGLLIISDEPSELLAVCDEILVVRRKRVAERLDRAETDEERLWELISQREVLP